MRPERADGGAAQPGKTTVVSLADATRAWFLISLQTFGGPAGQIAVMHRMLVDERRWIGEQRFLFALGYCTLLPGPEAQQLATYVGWLLNGSRGALIAGILFVLPGALVMLALSAIYVGFGDSGWLDAVFLGLAPAVIAIVLQAVVRVGRRGLHSGGLVAIAGGSFLALTVFQTPFPAVLAVAAGLGLLLGRRHTSVAPPPPVTEPSAPTPVVSDDALHTAHRGPVRTAVILVGGLLVWVAPIVLAAAFLGRSSVLVEQAVFFSGAAVVTFGGAYAVLSYVAYQAVEVYGWLAPGEMVRGLALAETTPGPLIMVVQFVAFVGAYRDPGSLDPWVAAVLASALTTWVTFVPSILFVLLGAPYVERLRNNQALASALAGITAAVVGIIANLAFYFTVQTLFSETDRVDAGPVSMLLPVPGSLQVAPLIVTVLALVLTFVRGWSVPRILGACALAGIALYAVGLGH